MRRILFFELKTIAVAVAVAVAVEVAARVTAAAVIGIAAVTGSPAMAQVAPTASEAAAYTGLHAATHQGDVAKIERLAASKADLNVRDGNGRTPLLRRRMQTSVGRSF